MCGIAVEVSCLSRVSASCLIAALTRNAVLAHGNCVDASYNKKKHLQLIRSRGPTLPCDVTEIAVSKDFELVFVASVLHLRGTTCISQPCHVSLEDAYCDSSTVINNVSVRAKHGSFVDSDHPSASIVLNPLRTSGVWLLWNGELFGGPSFASMTSHESDTSVVARALFQVFFDYTQAENPSLDSFESGCLAFLDQIEGPFSAIVYFGAPVCQLWVCRDKLGRRSLCAYAAGSSVGFSSVAPPDRTSNVLTQALDVAGVLVVSFECSGEEQRVRWLPWPHLPVYTQTDFMNPLCYSPSRSYEEVVTQLHRVLQVAVRKRTDISPLHSSAIGILFSGGVDSGLLAYLALEVATPNVTLELINVAFGNAFVEAPDRVTSLSTFLELNHLFPTSRINLICCNVSKDVLLTHERDIVNLIYPKNTHMDFNIGAPLYFGSRGIGVVIRENFHKPENAEWITLLENEVNTKYVYQRRDSRNGNRPEIDHSTLSLCEGCGARPCKALCSQKCCRTCCKRSLEMKEKQLSQNAERNHTSIPLRCSAHRHTLALSLDVTNTNQSPSSCLYDADLFSDHHTLCDICLEPHSLPTVTASSPLLLLGHGGDELFGGYARHTTTYRRGGASALRQELINELNRLWQRNLGRDDRCVSHWGREARHPFLDEQVLNFIAQLPIQILVSEKEDKCLLRSLARRLGLHRCSLLKKRAIQFGSRSSRQTNLQQFSSHRKASGSEVYIPVSVKHKEIL